MVVHQQVGEGLGTVGEDAAMEMPGAIRHPHRGQPACAGDLVFAETQRRRVGQAEGEGLDDDTTAYGAAGDGRLQAAGGGGVEDQADLFSDFTETGGEKIGVAGLATSAGEGPVTGPGIAGTVGAADQQDRRIRQVHFDEGDGGIHVMQSTPG